MVRNDELYHYGVLGMKWGVHRAKVNAKKYNRLSEKYKDIDRSDPKNAKIDKKLNKYFQKSEYRYKSHSTKKYERKGDRIREKINRGNLNDKQKEKLRVKEAIYDRRADRSKILDAREQAYAERVKVGGNIAMRLLTAGNIGGKSYQQYLAIADAQGKGNLGAKFVASRTNKRNSTVRKNVFHPKKKVRDPITARINSSFEKAAYLRTGEKDYIDEKFKKK